MLVDGGSVRSDGRLVFAAVDQLLSDCLGGTVKGLGQGSLVKSSNRLTRRRGRWSRGSFGSPGANQLRTMTR